MMATSAMITMTMPPSQRTRLRWSCLSLKNPSSYPLSALLENTGPHDNVPVIWCGRRGQAPVHQVTRIASQGWGLTVKLSRGWRFLPTISLAKQEQLPLAGRWSNRFSNMNCTLFITMNIRHPFYIFLPSLFYQYIPHKAVAEVSKIGNL